MVDSRKFWKHSFITAQVAKSLAKALSLNEEEQEKAYIAGLMHDIGILVMMYILPEPYQRFLQLTSARSPQVSGSHFCQLEENSFGAHHPTIGGAYVYRWWPVDDTITKAIVQHHSNMNDRAFPLLSRIIILANKYCYSAGYDNGLGMVSEKEAPGEIAFKSIGLDEDRTNNFLNNVAQDIESAEELMTIS
jgi:HD-like signal output (HDOD) protein